MSWLQCVLVACVLLCCRSAIPPHAHNSSLRSLAPTLGTYASTLACWAQHGSWRPARRKPNSFDTEYRWRADPLRCPKFSSFDKSRFCDALAGRSILVVGDSLSRQWHVTLQSMAGASQCTASGRQYVSGSCKGHWLCAGGPSRLKAWMQWRRSDHLPVDRTEFSFNRSSNIVEEPWVQLLAGRRSGFDIIVLNRGAHYEEDGPLLRQWRATLSFLLREYPSARLFVRTTPPGHRDCAKHRKPLSSRQPSAGLPHHWPAFARQNGKLRAMLNGDRAFASVTLLDVEKAVALRPDEHLLGKNNDCLHYRTNAGALRHQVLVFANALILANSQQ